MIKDYVLTGMLLAIGWHLVKLVYSIFEEIIFCRLHKSKSYAILAGKRKMVSDKESNTIKNHVQIGFH